MEIPLSNGKFTWSRETNPAHSLLNRFLITKSWGEIFDNCRVSRKVITPSDHFPLLLEAGAFEWGPSSFSFQ